VAFCSLAHTLMFAARNEGYSIPWYRPRGHDGGEEMEGLHAPTAWHEFSLSLQDLTSFCGHKIVKEMNQNDDLAEQINKLELALAEEKERAAKELAEEKERAAQRAAQDAQELAEEKERAAQRAAQDAQELAEEKKRRALAEEHARALAEEKERADEELARTRELLAERPIERLNQTPHLPLTLCSVAFSHQLRFQSKIR
jgi:hypothetical protein